MACSKGISISKMTTDRINLLHDRRDLIDLEIKRPQIEHFSKRTFSDAIQVLNSLQTNISIRVALQKDRSILNSYSLPGTIKFLERAGTNIEDLDALNVIHVAGTKGKGSTCAFIESILRHAGLRTGFFSSPHLVTVRERIRIDGKPISKEHFTKSFFDTYDKLDKLKENDEDMPAYFRFLTIMAFNVFLELEVDVAIIEVGIGGLYDSTNIIRNPKVVGITSLGLEHQSILGETLEEIALQKAGIMKSGCPIFTVDSHPPNIEAILREKATQINSPFFISPPLWDYNEVIDLGIDDGVVSRLNASLALQMANAFLSQTFQDKLDFKLIDGTKVKYEHGVAYPLLPWHQTGLEYTSWPGRFQVLHLNESLTLYMDGGHTIDSLEATRKWYFFMTPSVSLRILVFHVTGDRNLHELLAPFAEGNNFDLIIFCPIGISADLASKFKLSSESFNWLEVSQGAEILTKCNLMNEVWNSFPNQQTPSKIFSSVNECLDYLMSLSYFELNKSEEASVASDSGDDQQAEPSKEQEKTTNSLNLLEEPKEKEGGNQFPKVYRGVNVLVTGSIHFVGSFLTLLDPNLKN